MAYDIYGNNLRRGYCEVHPHVNQEYPCQICYMEIEEEERKRQEWEHNRLLEKKQYESAKDLPTLTLKEIADLKEVSIEQAKEIAEGLVNQFRIILMDEDTECGNELLCTSIAIKNSLICVNEIIQSIAKIEGIEKLGVIQLNELEYWREVKQQLEKL